MGFEIDNNTLNDLEIFSKRNGDEGIRALFKTTRTSGARDLLQKMMSEPLSDIMSLNERLNIIRHFRDNDLTLELNHNQVDLIEHYLKFNKRFLRDNPLDALYDHLSNKINLRSSYYIITEGILNILRLFRIAKGVIDDGESKGNITSALRKEACPLLLDDAFVVRIASLKRKLNCFEINKLDRYFRKIKIKEIKQLLDFVYHLDVYESAATVARKPGWSLPVFINDFGEMNLQGLFHPDIKTPILNDLSITGDQRLIFLTGPNMAGKSSFLKSMGLSVYLAHIGFPVPALYMKTPVFKGMVTTINLPDNLGDGLSHYYSEIRRIKYTALKIVEKGSLFVIFDELFRGTNPKDAFDASLLIIQALSKIPNCIFLISTHHTELAKELGPIDHVHFKYAESDFNDEVPKFSFKIKDGISHNRSGLHILKNEGVLDILEKAVKHSDGNGS